MHLKTRLQAVSASARRRPGGHTLAIAATLAVGAAAALPSVASAEPEGSYCSFWSAYGDECIASNLHQLTRSSAYSSSGLYVSAGAYTSGGGVYASLVYGSGWACHPYGGSNWLYGRARNSQTNSHGYLSGSKYGTGTTC